jgi:hypothetical protein
MLLRGVSKPTVICETVKPWREISLRLFLSCLKDRLIIFQTIRFLTTEDNAMGAKKICKRCGKEFDPDNSRENNRCTEGYHPQEAVEVGESGSPRYDYSTVYKYPCCGAVIFPQTSDPSYHHAPGCVYDIHIAVD